MEVWDTHHPGKRSAYARRTSRPELQQLHWGKHIPTHPNPAPLFLTPTLSAIRVAAVAPLPAAALPRPPSPSLVAASTRLLAPTPRPLPGRHLLLHQLLAAAAAALVRGAVPCKGDTGAVLEVCLEQSHVQGHAQLWWQ